jgi:succinate dehydrogenase/fumarate reductase flavoprotein subunit
MKQNVSGKQISRASFLKLGGAAALAGAVAVAASGCATDDAGGGQASGTTWDHETELVVIGSGLGGFTAALSAAMKGMKVILVEVSRHTGGGTSFCGGGLHCMGAGTTVEEYNIFTQYLSDTELGRQYSKDFLVLCGWLQDIGAAVSEPLIKPAFLTGPMLWLGEEAGLGCRGPRQFFDSMEALFAENGGTLMLQTTAQKILTDADDKIIGLKCHDKDGKTVRISTKAVVIASGGFQANEELRARYLGYQADMATIHAVPYCTGNGMKMAEELGASLAGSMSSFSATLAAAWPAVEFDTMPEDYEARDYVDGDDGKYWLYSEHIDYIPSDGIFLNLDGERYVDEGEVWYRIPQATVKQKRSTSIIICDSLAWESWMGLGTDGAYYTVRDQIEKVLCGDKVGGKYYKADSYEELADLMNASGIATHMINKSNFLKTMEEYNAAVFANAGADLRVPRVQGSNVPLLTGPFYAFPTRPAIYATWGGVMINTKAQVLDKNHEPIPGLYCCAPAAGGIMREVYTGAVGMAGVTGYWAGNAAAEDVTLL